MSNGNGKLIEEWLSKLAADDLLPKAPAYTDHSKVSRETYHDFSSYLYVLDPWANRPHEVPAGQPAIPAESQLAVPQGPSAPEQPASDPQTLDWLEADAAQMVETFIAESRRASVDPNAFDEGAIRELLQRFLLRATGALSSIYLAPGPVPGRRAQLLYVFIERAVPDLIDRYSKLPLEHRATFLTKLDTAVTEWAERTAYVEQPWLWFTSGEFALRSNWESWGYTIGATYSALPPAVPPFSPQYHLPASEVHLLTWDTRVDDIDGVPIYGTAYLQYTVTFLGGRRVHSKKPSLSDELNRLLALVPAAPPPDPASAWLTRLVEELDKGLLGIKATPEAAARPEDRYGFKPYPYPSINIGLQVIYRQTWTSMDPGQGELVKTIPLGPGQTEKITIRRLEREKITRELTDTSSTETERETSSKTTISSEIVEEAAKSSKWHIDQTGEGGVNMGVWHAGGSTSGGYESSSSSSSRDTKKRLNEVAQRTTAKMRRESRIVVTTERERTFEATQASEIRNPNEELSVTYYYYALQQQYEVKTRLAAAEPVLFVAERMPKPSELTISWIQRYDWLLGENLLDESFRDILTKVSTLDLDGLKKEIEAKETEVDTLKTAVIKAQSSLESLQSLSGNVSNTYEGTLKAYQDAVRSALELARQVQATVRDAQRLGQHIADNILHYMRGIWSQEDPDRRRMRYSAIAWPTRFTRVEDSASVSADGSTTSVFGHFAPVAGSEQPLSELIDPSGPIAFAGNYSVFRLRKTALTADLTALIRERQLEFTHQTFITSATVDSVEMVAPFNFQGETYSVKLTGGNPTAAISYTVTRTPPRADVDGEDVTVVDVAGKEFRLQRAGLLVKLKAPMAQNDVVDIVPGPLELRDPELSFLRSQRPTVDINVLEKELLDANTRMIVVDTDNVYLKIDPSPLLEPFKQYHRIIDVASALAEVQRRGALLKTDQLGDPKVDKVIVVAHGNRADAGVVAPVTMNMEIEKSNGEANPVE